MTASFKAAKPSATTLCSVIGILFVRLTRAFPTTSPQVVLQGRFGGNVDDAQFATGYDALPIIFSWAASSAFVTFNSTSVNVSLTAVDPTDIFSGYNRFRFEIDQVVAETLFTDLDNNAISWGTTGLRPGLHNLTITKLSEPAYGQANLTAITLGSGGTFVDPAMPASLQSGRRMLVIGDSFASGWADVGGVDACAFSACTPYGCLPQLDSQDATLAWGPLAAQILQADFQLIAWEGTGAVTYQVSELNAASSSAFAALPDWLQQAQYPLETDLFTRQVAGDNMSTIQNYSSWKPQIVVMAGGLNDFVLGDPPVLEDWRSSYLSFLQEVSDVYDEPEIIVFNYPLESNFNGNLSPNQTTYYLQYMNSLYQQTQMQGMSNVYLVQMDGIDFPIDTWCAGHPSAAAHASMANQLTSFINGVMPHWGNTTFPVISTDFASTQ